MKKLICAVLITILLVGCIHKPLTNQEKVKIVVASDIHYFLKDYYKDCTWFEESMLYGDGKMVTYADEILDAFMQEIKQIQPHLVILTGDLSFNGEVGSHEGLASKFSTLQKEGIQVAVIPGNHDIDNIYTKGYGQDDYFDVENVNAQRFKSIYKELGYQKASSQHDESLSYRIDINDQYSFLMMDSNSHELTTGSSLDIGGQFTDSTMIWMKKELDAITKEKKTPLIAMHHNLTNHNELLNSGFTIKDNQKIADVFKEYHVPFVLSGHIHCQNIKQVNGIYDIASSSLLDAPLQYGVIELDSQHMNYRTQSLKISKDANDYFDDVSSHRFSESFEVIKDKTIREQMKEVVVKANRYYFTGNIKDHTEEIKEMPGYDYFYKSLGDELSFYKGYLESMLKDQDENQKLSISF